MVEVSCRWKLSSGNLYSLHLLFYSVKTILSQLRFIGSCVYVLYQFYYQKSLLLHVQRLCLSSEKTIYEMIILLHIFMLTEKRSVTAISRLDISFDPTKAGKMCSTDEDVVTAIDIRCCVLDLDRETI
jgi:hypothetical protein